MEERKTCIFSRDLTDTIRLKDMTAVEKGLVYLAYPVVDIEGAPEFYTTPLQEEEDTPIRLKIYVKVHVVRQGRDFVSDQNLILRLERYAYKSFMASTSTETSVNELPTEEGMLAMLRVLMDANITNAAVSKIIVDKIVEWRNRWIAGESDSEGAGLGPAQVSLLKLTVFINTLLTEDPDANLNFISHEYGENC